MIKQIRQQIHRQMGDNLRRMRKGKGWTQEHLAGLIKTNKRYISLMEGGRGIGEAMLGRLCAVFEVDEEAFTAKSPEEALETEKKLVPAIELPTVIRRIVDELETMEEYEQLRVLADILESRMKKAEAQLREIGSLQ